MRETHVLIYLEKYDRKIILKQILKKRSCYLIDLRRKEKKSEKPLQEKKQNSSFYEKFVIINFFLNFRRSKRVIINDFVFHKERGKKLRINWPIINHNRVSNYSIKIVEKHSTHSFWAPGRFSMPILDKVSWITLRGRSLSKKIERTLFLYFPSQILSTGRTFLKEIFHVLN